MAMKPKMAAKKDYGMEEPDMGSAKMSKPKAKKDMVKKEGPVMRPKSDSKPKAGKTMRSKAAK